MPLRGRIDPAFIASALKQRGASGAMTRHLVIDPVTAVVYLLLADGKPG